MNTNNQLLRKYNESDVNWEDLSNINIFKDELERNGNLEKLLCGEKTDVMNLHLQMLGVDLDLDATLQIVEEAGNPIVEILGIKPDYVPNN